MGPAEVVVLSISLHCYGHPRPRLSGRAQSTPAPWVAVNEELHHGKQHSSYECGWIIEPTGLAKVGSLAAVVQGGRWNFHLAKAYKALKLGFVWNQT